MCNRHAKIGFMLYLCVVTSFLSICRLLSHVASSVSQEARLPRSVLSSSQALHHLRHLIPASQKLTHLLVSQACLQASPVPQLTQPPWGGGQAFNPAARGELLMAAVMAMAQPSQHTQGSATLLKALQGSFGLAAAAQSAIAKVSKPCCIGCCVASAQFCRCVWCTMTVMLAITQNNSV